MKELPVILKRARPDINGNCRRCVLRAAIGSPYPGVKIPGRTGFGGKCIRPGGLCDNYKETY